MDESSNRCSTVLIVDDDSEASAALTEILSELGYAATVAPNGRVALNYLRGNDAPCVILLDLMMPVMDGWEFRDRQLQDPRLATIPTLITTAVSASYLEAGHLPGVSVFPKPLDVPQLMQAIQRHCGSPRA